MKTVLITGATSGFGAAAAKKFVAEGHQVILTGRRQERLDELKNELGDRAMVHALDVRERDAVFALIDAIPDEFRNIDVLLNNAGLALGLGGADVADVDQ